MPEDLEIAQFDLIDNTTHEITYDYATGKVHIKASSK